MPLPLLVNDEQAAAAWIGSIPGFTPAMVAPQLPPDANTDGSPAAWLTTGFITVSVAGGSPDPAVDVRKPVIQADCWAATPGSNFPPWPDAAILAEQIRFACHNRQTIHRPLMITQAGVVYPGAIVLGAWVMTEPRRVYDDAGDYARYSMDIQMHWVQVGEENP